MVFDFQVRTKDLEQQSCHEQRPKEGATPRAHQPRPRLYPLPTAVLFCDCGPDVSFSSWSFQRKNNAIHSTADDELVWNGFESAGGLTANFSRSAGAYIVFTDNSHKVDLEGSMMM